MIVSSLYKLPRWLNDWEKCIICYTHAKNGVIRHDRRCPSYIKLSRSSMTTQVRMGDVIYALSRMRGQ